MNVHPKLIPAALAVALFVNGAGLVAQGGGRTSYRQSRNTKEIRKAFSPAVDGVFASTVQVRSGGKVVAYGTVVAAGGLILTKASELGSEVEVVVSGGGEPIEAKVIGSDRANDLALLSVAKKGLTPVQFAVDNTAKVGSFLVSAADVPVPLAYGVMSTPPHSREAVAFLGVRSEAASKGARLLEVVKNSAAEAAGLLKGDLVTAVEGKPLRSPQDLSIRIRRKKPGQKFKLRVRRGEKTLDVTAELRQNGDRHGPISSQERSGLWGPLSDVRVGMEQVIQHDTVLRPNQCGGPLCTLTGEVVGINIARVGRMETIAVTSAVVLRSLTKMLKDRPATKVR